MSKAVMPADKYARIVREAEDVAAVLKMPGWKVIADDLRQQMRRVKDILAENRLRTTEETRTTRTGTTTTILTAETQIAENAGMYKMCQRVFELVKTISEAPARIQEMEAKGHITVERPKTEGGDNNEQR